MAIPNIVGGFNILHLRSWQYQAVEVEECWCPRFPGFQWRLPVPPCWARMTSPPSSCRLEAGGMGELERGTTDEARHLIIWLCFCGISVNLTISTVFYTQRGDRIWQALAACCTCRTKDLACSTGPSDPICNPYSSDAVVTLNHTCGEVPVSRSTRPSPSRVGIVSAKLVCQEMMGLSPLTSHDKER